MRLFAYLVRLWAGLTLIAVGVLLIGVTISGLFFVRGTIARMGLCGPVCLVIGLLPLMVGIKFLSSRSRWRESLDPEDCRSKDHDWQNDPATEAQMILARELGITFPAKITRGALADLIANRK